MKFLNLKNKSFDYAGSTAVKRGFATAKCGLATIKGGFTLIEVLFYVVLASSLLITTSVLLVEILKGDVKNQTVIEVEQQGLQVMDIISQTIRNAQEITSPTIGNSGTGITLAFADSNLDPTVFDLLDGTLRIKEGDDNPVVLTNGLVTASDFTVTNLSKADSPGTVRVSFTLTRINSSGRNEYDFAKTFVFSGTIRPNQ